MLLLILPFILLGAILAHRGRNRAWQRMVAPRLQSQLVQKTSTTRRWVSLGFGLLAAAFLILCIARPYIGETTTVEQISSRNILIAIDTSRSMQVRDASPDRMASAQAMALELLEAFPDDRVGVIAFSGVPLLMAPLTIDHAAVHETIAQLDTQVIPTGGSDLNAAVQLALQTFKKTGQQNNALIIISDGESHSESISLAADDIRKSGNTVCAISIGTKEGGIIPDYRQRDRKFRDIYGQTVLSKMTSEALDTLARAGRGAYTEASTGASATVTATLASLQRNQQQGNRRVIPFERFQWVLLPAILLMSLCLLIRSQLFSRKKASGTGGFVPRQTTRSPPPVRATTEIPSKKSPSKPTRKTIPVPLIACGLLGLLSPPAAEAASMTERAEQAYDQKKYERAYTLFSGILENASEKESYGLYFAQGASAYRLQQWDRASQAFSSSLLSNALPLQESSHYNLGKTLFRSGLSIRFPEQANESVFSKIFSRLTANHDPSGNAKALSDDDYDKMVTSWQDSIDHYQAAINLNPHNQAAIANQTHVKNLLKQLKKNRAQEDNSQTDAPDQKPQQNAQENSDKNQPQNKEPKENSEDSADNDQKKTADNNQEDNQKPSEQGDPDDPNNKEGDDRGEGEDNNDTSDNSDNQANETKENQVEPDKSKARDRKSGESEESYAARILKENSDAETRPVKRQFLRLRRPTKDW